jgi:hypothetical protein
MAVLYQLFGILPVNGFPLTLAVRPVSTAMLYAFIRFKPAPFQGIENIFFRAVYITALVRVFDPH